MVDTRHKKNYEIQYIGGHRLYKNRLQYKVKWKNYSKRCNSWVYESDLNNCQEAISRYVTSDRKNNGKITPKKSKKIAPKPTLKLDTANDKIVVIEHKGRVLTKIKTEVIEPELEKEFAKYSNKNNSNDQPKNNETINEDNSGNSKQRDTYNKADRPLLHNNIPDKFKPLIAKEMTKELSPRIICNKKVSSNEIENNNIIDCDEIVIQETSKIVSSSTEQSKPSTSRGIAISKNSLGEVLNQPNGNKVGKLNSYRSQHVENDKANEIDYEIIDCDAIDDDEEIIIRAQNEMTISCQKNTKQRDEPKSRENLNRTSTSTGENLIRRNTSTGENLNRRNTSTGENLNRTNTSTGENLNGRKTSTGENLNGRNTSTGENLNRMNASTGENLNRTNTSTGENLNRTNTLTGENLNRRNTSTGENLNGRNMSTGENLNRINTLTGDNLNGRNTSTGENFNRINTSTGENLNGRNTSTGENLNGRNTSTGENLNRINTSTGENLNRRNTSTGENLNGRNTPTGENLNGRNTSTGENLNGRNTSNGENLNRMNTSTGENLNRINTLTGANLNRMNMNTSTNMNTPTNITSNVLKCTCQNNQLLMKDKYVDAFWCEKGFMLYRDIVEDRNILVDADGRTFLMLSTISGDFYCTRVYYET